MEQMGSQPVLSQPEAFARIRLLRSPNIGPDSYRQLLELELAGELERHEGGLVWRAG